MFGVHDREVLCSLIPRQNSPGFSVSYNKKVGLAEKEEFWNWVREGNVYYC